MKEKLQELQELALKQIEAAAKSSELEEIRVKFIGKKGELTTRTIKISMFELYIEKVNELLGSNCAYLLKSKTSGLEENYYYFNALIELGYDKKEIFDKMIEFTRISHQVQI